MTPAIRVENLSKRYRISHEGTAHGKYRTLRDTLSDFAAAPFRRLKNRGESSASADSQEDFFALKDVSFDVQPGEVVGIIGRNGAGKSTLLKILSRITKPSAGRVTLNGRVGSLLEVGTGFHPELTGRENIFLNGSILGMTRAEITKQFDAIVDFSGVEKFLDTPVKRYSSGMYVRLAFAVAAHLEPEILIIDEVLAVGDAEFQRKCLGKLKDVAKCGRTVLFVSHNMGAVQGLCTMGILMVSGLVGKVGTVGEVLHDYLSAATNSKAIFNSGPLKWIQIQQLKEGLRIEAAYSHSEYLKLPCLGIIVSDAYGTPIFGINPNVSGIDQVPFPERSGTVRATIVSPKLLDGLYRLSAWFGDGSLRNFAEYVDCVTFEVSGWAGSRQLPASRVGAAFPECDWQFQGPTGL